MIYLIGQLAAWLLLTVAFAALAGWSFAAYRAAADDAKARRDREHVTRDLAALIVKGAHPEEAVEAEREREAARRMATLQDARVTELEQALAAARGHTDEAAARAAELERAIAALHSEREETRMAIDVEHEPVAAAPASDPENDPALQNWRLRYFEQRVRYLENAARETAPPEPAPAPPQPAPPLTEWRARVAEARAAYAENAVRAIAAPVGETAPEASEASPFAANADIDVLLRWRMLYLERRLAHRQAPAAEAEPQIQTQNPTLAEAGPDMDRWKWRARYLEARARHLEQRLNEGAALAAPPLAAPIDEPEEAEAEPPPAAPPARRAKPLVLQAARRGAPDDLTLIENVSVLQQTTFYALGVFHYDQIAAWSDENVAWIDHYLRLRGRIDAEEWREQADALAREGPAAARRMLAEEDA